MARAPTTYRLLHGSMINPAFAEKYVEPLISALAAAVDGNPHVWYIKPGFGHIGNLTAQPSKGGHAAFIEAGFTADKWADYCHRTVTLYQKSFKKTPLMVMSAGMLLRDRKRSNYETEATRILIDLRKQDVTVIHYGLEADRTRMVGIYETLARLVPDARKGILRIGLGDDWPLWVPESRRNKGPTFNHDDDFLRASLTNAFGGSDGLPGLPTTILYFQMPEALASHPKSRDYRPSVEEIVRRARERLFKNDAALFGKR
jgi:hypothetical protein